MHPPPGPGGVDARGYWHRTAGCVNIRRVQRVRAIALAATAAAALLSACDPSDDTPEAARGCTEIVREASLAQEVDEQIGLLDDAMRVCRSYGAFEAELTRYPSIIGYAPETFVLVRCSRTDDEAVLDSAACRSVIEPTTTVPPTTIASVVFVGDTLDGRTIEIRPSASVEFVGDVPAVVQQTVDIAVESGCPGVIAQRDRWAAPRGRSGDRRRGLGLCAACAERGRLHPVQHRARHGEPRLTRVGRRAIRRRGRAPAR